jgi:hypothetical protein
MCKKWRSVTAFHNIKGNLFQYSSRVLNTIFAARPYKQKFYILILVKTVNFILEYDVKIIIKLRKISVNIFVFLDVAISGVNPNCLLWRKN